MANTKSGGKGVQGGTPEQHAEAGRQSHKNDGSRQSSGGGSKSGSSAWASWVSAPSIHLELS